MTGYTETDLHKLAKTARLMLLHMHAHANVGHIGGNLSCIDALITLFHRILRDEDCFVLSKGHSAGALYVALWSRGLLNESDLKTFHQDDTILAGHPSPNSHPAIPFATGSLGHGLSLTCGLALARQLNGRAGRAYCLTSDGEWQEGSTLEALLFAHARQLPLTVLVDHNGLQGLGATVDIVGDHSIAALSAAMGIATCSIDGHDPEAIHSALRSQPNGPLVIICQTIKGKGVSFMENRVEWHYKPMTRDEYIKAVDEVQYQ